MCHKDTLERPSSGFRLGCTEAIVPGRVYVQPISISSSGILLKLAQKGSSLQYLRPICIGAQEKS